MDDIIIRVKATEAGMNELAKQLDELKAANSRVEKEVSTNHGKSVARHKEELDFNTKLTRSFHELGEGIIAAFAVEKIIEWSAEAVKGYAEAEEANRKLKLTIMVTNGQSEESFLKLNEQAENLSKTLSTLYTKKEIEALQTQLANYGLTSAMIQKLTPRILDLASANGKTLPEATEKAIMAINGQTKGLRDIGVSFKDTGSKTENFNKLMQDTAKFTGGAAEKAKGLSGELDENKKKMEEFQEGFGGALVEFGSMLSEGFVEIGKDIGAATFEFLKFLGVLKDGAKYVEPSVDNLKKMTEEELKDFIKETAGAADVQIKTFGRLIGTTSQDMINAQEALYQKGLEKMDVNNLKKAREDIEKELKEISNSKNLSIPSDAQVDEMNKTNPLGFSRLTLQRKLALLEEAIEEQHKMDNDATLKGEEEAKSAAEKRLKLQAEFDKTLLELKKKDYEDGEKYSLSQIKDELDRMLAAEEMGTEKLYNELLDRRDKLAEIQNSPDATADQKRRATNEQQELNGVLESLEKDHQEKLQKIRDDYAAKQKKQWDDEEKKKIADEQKANKDEMDYLLEQNNYQTELEKTELKKRLADKQISQEKYEKESSDIELQGMEDRLKIENDHGVQDLNLQNDIENKKIDLQMKSAEKQKELLNGLKEAAAAIFEGMGEDIQQNIDAIDGQMDRQNRMIEEQKVLAERGLNNDLAFEEKRADALALQKSKEQKKLKDLKELEVFLNSVATYTQAGNNPAEAIGKALGILAATKAAEAVFSEKGGIIGIGGETSLISGGYMSRRHKSGNDILLHAERGEGVIPTPVMTKWGLTDNTTFSKFLQHGFNEKLIPASNTVVVNNNAEVVKRLESLEDTVKNKPETSVDWDAFNQMVLTIKKDGVTKKTTYLQLGNRKATWGG